MLVCFLTKPYKEVATDFFGMFLTCCDAYCVQNEVNIMACRNSTNDLKDLKKGGNASSVGKRQTRGETKAM